MKKVFQHTAVLALMASIASCTQAKAANDLWTIDPEHSQVVFKVKHMAVSSIVGEFKNLTGTVEFDGRNLRQANVQAMVDTQSLNTHSPQRDERWKGKAFFDADQYPRISFKSQKIVPDQSGNFKIQGILAIHGYAR